MCLVYACVLTIGLLTLPSPHHQIQQPWFTLMEVLIIAIAPAMVTLTVALHAWVPPERHPAFADQPWARMVFSFEWPSVAYALDILAWDVFFPLAVSFAAVTVRGPGLAGAVRRLLFASAALSLVGLAGVPMANMYVRNLGIIGYAVLFPIAAALMVFLFRARTNGHV